MAKKQQISVSPYGNIPGTTGNTQSPVDKTIQDLVPEAGMRQLLNQDKYRNILLGGGRIKYEDLPQDIARQLGVSQGQSVNLKRPVREKISQASQISDMIKQIMTQMPLSPIQSVEDMLTPTMPMDRISPRNISTGEAITTSVGKGVKKTVPQRTAQTIPIREAQPKSVLDVLGEVAKSIGGGALETTGWPLILRSLQTLQDIGQYQIPQGIENITRTISPALTGRSKQRKESDILTALKQQTGVPRREAAGSVINLGGKRYTVNASGQIVQLIEPTM